MKSWTEAKDGMLVYIKEPIEFEDESGNIQYTKLFQKAYVADSLSDDPNLCTVVVADKGVADGEDFYFYHNESNPEGLLTSKEYKEFKKTKFEQYKNESGNYKICPKCKKAVDEKYKVAFEKEWCPYCGYGIIK